MENTKKIKKMENYIYSVDKRGRDGERQGRGGGD